MQSRIVRRSLPEDGPESTKIGMESIKCDNEATTFDMRLIKVVPPEATERCLSWNAS